MFSFIATVQGQSSCLRTRVRQPGYNNVAERHSSYGLLHQMAFGDSRSLLTITDIRPEGPYFSVVSPAMEEHVMTTVPENAKTDRCIYIEHSSDAEWYRR